MSDGPIPKHVPNTSTTATATTRQTQTFILTTGREVNANTSYEDLLTILEEEDEILTEKDKDFLNDLLTEQKNKKKNKYGEILSDDKTIINTSRTKAELKQMLKEFTDEDDIQKINKLIDRHDEKARKKVSDLYHRTLKKETPEERKERLERNRRKSATYRTKKRAVNGLLNLNKTARNKKISKRKSRKISKRKLRKISKRKSRKISKRKNKSN